MRSRSLLSLALAAVLVLIAGTMAVAQDISPEELAAESEAKAAATATDKVTTDMIIAKIEEGCKVLQAEGMGALSKFQGKDSPFIFSGTYIWIHDMEGKMVMHPIKYKMNGNPLLGLKDAQGKLFFAVMNQVAAEKGAGWVDYMWPKPGEKGASQKISYVKLCKVGDHELVLGCGVYDVPPDEVEKLKNQ